MPDRNCARRSALPKVASSRKGFAQLKKKRKSLSFNEERGKTRHDMITIEKKKYIFIIWQVRCSLLSRLFLIKLGRNGKEFPWFFLMHKLNFTGNPTTCR